MAKLGVDTGKKQVTLVVVERENLFFVHWERSTVTNQVGGLPLPPLSPYYSYYRDKNEREKEMGPKTVSEERGRSTSNGSL